MVLHYSKSRWWPATIENSYAMPHNQWMQWVMRHSIWKHHKYVMHIFLFVIATYSANLSGNKHPFPHTVLAWTSMETSGGNGHTPFIMESVLVPLGSRSLDYMECLIQSGAVCTVHDDVIKRKYFPRYWLFVRGTTSDRWIPLTKASDAELWCFLWSRLSKQSRHRMIWDSITLIMTSP